MAELTLKIGFDASRVDEFIEAARAVMMSHRRARLPEPLFEMASVATGASLLVTLTPTRRASEWLQRWQER